MNENLINLFDNNEDGFLKEEILSDDSESNGISSVSHSKIIITKLPVVKKFHTSKNEDVDEESSETEYPSCSKERKRRIVWSKNAEKQLLDIWGKKYGELRGARKTAHIYRQIAEQMKVSGNNVSGNEVKIKIQNLQAKYIDEKKKMGPSGSATSTWVHYSKVHSIVGEYKFINLTHLLKEKKEVEYRDIHPCSSEQEFLSASIEPESRKRRKVTDQQAVKESADGVYQETQLYSSDHEFPTASVKPEHRKSKKDRNQQAELISTLNTANRIAEKDLILQEKEFLNSQKQTVLMEQQIEILKRIIARTQQFNAKILELLNKK